VIARFGDKTPAIADTAFVVESAVVIGDVVLGAEASIWFHAVVRGDIERIGSARGPTCRTTPPCTSRGIGGRRSSVRTSRSVTRPCSMAARSAITA
jgi:hypothetical protein